MQWPSRWGCGHHPLRPRVPQLLYPFPAPPHPSPSQIAKLTPREEVARAVARVCVDGLDYLAPGEAKLRRGSSAAAHTSFKREGLQPVHLQGLTCTEFHTS